jgi:predicted nucleic acid-binding protein
MVRYVLDTGALISAERGKARAVRFLRLARIGRARIIVPLPVVAERWRGRTDAREEILAASQVVAPLAVVKAAGVALARAKDVDSKLTIDAIVMATAALMDGDVVTGDPGDFDRLAPAFPGVAVLSAQGLPGCTIASQRG